MTTHELAYLNGTFISAEDAHVDVTDWGFVQGVTLAEQLRTFRGRPLCVEEHVRRLVRGLELIQSNWTAADTKFAAIIQQVADHNSRLLDPLDDLGICVFVTPGTYPSFSVAGVGEPTVCVHSFALPFRLWHGRYADGLTLISVNTRQVPASCWPPELKCRSRMHYYLAAKEARRQVPDATPLLMDEQEFISETPTANVVGFFADAGLVSPPQDKILRGVSLDFLRQLAGRLGVPFEFRDLTLSDLTKADEIILTSTPFCLLPVKRLNDQPLESPGPMYRQLLEAWSKDVGVDIAKQAADFAERE